jgi:hypothetical protein
VLSWYYFFGLIWFFVAHQGLQKGLRQITGSGFKKIIFFGSQTAVIKNKSQHRLALGVFESFSSNWGPGLKLKILALAAYDIEVLKGEAGSTYPGGKI